MDMKKLIQGCRNLNRTSQREMVDYLSPYLYAICRRYTDSHEDAKDVLQDSLISIFNNMDQCKSNETAVFKSWSARITVNTALSKKRKLSYKMERNELETDTRNFSPPVHSQLNVEDILKLLHLLPEKQRTVFNMVVIDGFSHKETAQMLQIKESSSRTFLVRAREKMQQLITKLEID